MQASYIHRVYIHIFIFIIIQVHHVTCTLGLLSHVAPCITTEDGLKWVKSLVQMIESTLPQILDGFANITIPACLVQYHYYFPLPPGGSLKSHDKRHPPTCLDPLSPSVLDNMNRPLSIEERELHQDSMPLCWTDSVVDLPVYYTCLS